MKKYYVLDDLTGYGSDFPVCVDEAEKDRLSYEWNASEGEWHEASEEEIAEYGTYDTDPADAKIEKAEDCRK